jgi:hypothetical protein
LTIHAKAENIFLFLQFNTSRIQKDGMGWDKKQNKCAHILPKYLAFEVQNFNETQLFYCII